MTKILFFISLLTFFTTPTQAQDWKEVDNTLEKQFNKVVEESNSFQEYKVVSKVKLAALQKSIFDSIAAMKKEIAATKSEFAAHNRKVDSLSKNISSLKKDLSGSIAKENGIMIFGTLTSKALYNVIMWGIILILLAVGGFLLFKYLNTHKVTKITQLKMAEMEIELDEARQGSIDREQKLRRKLQDEINKNRLK